MEQEYWTNPRSLKILFSLGELPQSWLEGSRRYSRFSPVPQGGLINNTKINLYAWNVSPGILAMLMNILQFDHENNWKSFNYLGIPTSLKSLTCYSWTLILEKIKREFLIWGSHWPNLAGQLIFVKSVLFSLHVFQFSTLMAPISIK